MINFKYIINRTCCDKCKSMSNRVTLKYSFIYIFYEIIFYYSTISATEKQ